MGFLLIGVFLLPFLPSVFLHKYQPITAALHSPESLVCHPRLPAVPHKLLKKLSFFSVASLQPALVTQNLVLFCICQLHSCPFRYQFNTFFLAFSCLQPKKKKQTKKNPSLPRSCQLALLSAHLRLLPQNPDLQLHIAEEAAHACIFCCLSQSLRIISQLLPPSNYFFFRLMGSLKTVLTCVTPCDAPSVVDFYVFTY